jgi:hypothetical protein
MRCSGSQQSCRKPLIDQQRERQYPEFCPCASNGLTLKLNQRAFLDGDIS